MSIRILEKKGSIYTLKPKALVICTDIEGIFSLFVKFRVPPKGRGQDPLDPPLDPPLCYSTPTVEGELLFKHSVILRTRVEPWVGRAGWKYKQDNGICKP